MIARNLRKKILVEARGWIGTPYCHQASTKGQGADCLGLVRGIWRHLYKCEPQPLPSYSRDWGEVSNQETLLNAADQYFISIAKEEARAGDLVVFRWKRSAIAKHVGILSDKRNFIHAYERAGVIETTLGPHWTRRIAGTFRFPDPENR